MDSNDIKKAQKELGLTNLELARLLDCSLSLVNKMRSGTSPITRKRELILRVNLDGQLGRPYDVTTEPSKNLEKLNRLTEIFRDAGTKESDRLFFELYEFIANLEMTDEKN